MSEISYLQLHLAKGIGPATIRKILTRLDQTGTSLKEFLQLPIREQVSRFGLAQRQAQSLQTAHTRLEKTCVELEQRCVKLLSHTAMKYPAQLRKRLGDQSPPLLYVWGNLDLLQQKAVGFCGARDASSQGLTAAEDCATQLATWDWVVVSGGARGVDTMVHRTALINGGNTIIVLPEGILRYRLRSNLRQFISPKNALLISEFPPYMSWSVANAMQRNRTVCGLSHALVVIEAGASGGTFNAGKMALRLNVPLFVVDYAEPSASAAGNAYFLARGAHPLRRRTATRKANLNSLRRIVEASPESELLPIQDLLVKV
jgi:DNA protecting protein DprA